MYLILKIILLTKFITQVYAKNLFYTSNKLKISIDLQKELEQEIENKDLKFFNSK